MPWLRAISTNIPILLDGIETSYTSEPPRKKIPVIKGIPKVLKGRPLMTQGTPVISAKNMTLPRFVLGTYVGEKCVDKKART
jgi:hypothetical protein